MPITRRITGRPIVKPIVGPVVGVGENDAGITDPTDIANLVLWMDGADISTMWLDDAKTMPVTSDDDAVELWEDKSTTAHQVKQISAAAKPKYKTGVQNGKSAVLGDGGDDMGIQGTSCLTSTLNVSIFAVANVSSDDTIGTIFCNTFNDVERTVMFVDSRTANKTNSVVDTLADASVVLTNTSDIDTEAVQQTFIRDGASLEVWLNGVSQDTDTVTAGSETTNDAIRVFAQHQALTKLTGHIFELVIYEASLSSVDRESVEAYLVSKWGL